MSRGIETALGLIGGLQGGLPCLILRPSICLEALGDGDLSVISWVADSMPDNSKSMAHSLIGAAGGDVSSMLGSRTNTSREQFSRCSKLCLASLIGASGLRIPSECRSSSPTNGTFGTLNSHDELDRFDRTTRSAEHPRASSGVNTETLLVKLEPPVIALV